MSITAPNYVQGQYSVADRDRIFAKADKYPDASAGITNQVPTLAADGSIIWRQQSSGGGDGTANANIAVVEDTSTASQAYAVGDLLVYSGQLYRVTAAIAQGGTITPGTNVTPTTVADELESGGGGGGVSSFNGRTGAVTPQSGDYSASDVGALPAPSNTGTAGQVLTKTADGSEWANESGGGGNDANLAPVETTSTASQAYAVNSFLVYGGQLYRVTAAIAQGDTLTVGTNIAAADVGTYLAMVAAAPNAGGFAPAGYGSAGETLAKIGIGASTEAEFNTQLSTFFQTLPNRSFSAVCIYPDWLSDGTAYLGIIFKAGASYGSLVVMPNYNLGNDIHGVKRLINNVWSPYEWVNPPLTVDTEYRTTERYNGKPVYVQVFTIPSSVRGARTVYDKTITNFGLLVDVKATIHNAWNMPNLYGCTNLSTSGYAAYLDGASMQDTSTFRVAYFIGTSISSGWNPYITVKYVKTTD